MRICIIRNAEGEMNAQLERVASALFETKNDFFLITRNRDASEKGTVIKKEIIIDNKKIDNYEIQLPAIIGGGLKNVLPVLEFKKILSQWLEDNLEKYDAIHAIDYDVGSVALKICKKNNKKLIYHIADFYADSRLSIPAFAKKILRQREYTIINRADATIICSEDRFKQIEGSFPKKVIVVHNTPARRQMITKEDVRLNNKDSLMLTYVGGLEKKRFIDKVISVVKGQPNYKLILAGSLGDARESFEHIDKIENITYVGKQPYEKALELYQSTDVMFAIYDPDHPNHRYSAANKVYEAMLMGKAIIVAKNTGMDKIVEVENMGYTIEFDQQDFSELLTHISNNREELYEKSLNAYHAYKKYSWEEMKKRLILLYEELG